MNDRKSFPEVQRPIAEFSGKVFVLSILLSLVLAVANAYLALKIGLLVSASIPAAIISMSILRLFKDTNILQNNLVQTAASAGEAVAGGIVYTIPALVIIGYWQHFSYWENFFIAVIGGVLGVMFSIPLRRVLMRNPKLRFPEGRAIAEVLKLSESGNVSVKDVLMGGLVGMALEFCQIGIKVMASGAQAWVKFENVLFGFGLGFSPAMIGAGYLIGYELVQSIFFGAVLSWFFGVASFSHFYPQFVLQADSTAAAMQLWGDKLRFVGIGAMLVAGIVTLTSLIRPLLASFKISTRAIKSAAEAAPLQSDRDIPLRFSLVITFVFIIGLLMLYHHLFPLEALKITGLWSHGILYGALVYTVGAGFVFCAITAYFSGMVGVTASPGSSVVIASLLLAAVFLMLTLRQFGFQLFTPEQVLACEATTIICAAMITGMAAIANDNMQDLKVGALLGATPWKQEVMLLLGVVCAAAVIAPVMQILYEVYGIANVMPRPGMDPTATLPAPPAVVMAALSGAVFRQVVPWAMFSIGAGVVVALMVVNGCRKFQRKAALPLLGIAIGMYLPLSSSVPLYIGGLLAQAAQKKDCALPRCTMIACGLIAGSALLDVMMAIPFSLLGSSDVLRLLPRDMGTLRTLLSLLSVYGLYRWFCGAPARTG